ncbi:hypothetical protein [uncultured Gimesia sp.]|uniref:hypothetical protein n=1 Tax=uncultured Gimesia sp. TaxID=1678688 RepID=UPI00260FEDFB|nr:hypothetical protein [uncultured Gimesia sp.]
MQQGFSLQQESAAGAAQVLGAGAHALGAGAQQAFGAGAHALGAGAQQAFGAGAHALGAGAQQALGAGAAHAFGAGVQQLFPVLQFPLSQLDSLSQQRRLNQPRSLRAGLQQAGAVSPQQGGLMLEHAR